MLDACTLCEPLSDTGTDVDSELDALKLMLTDPLMLVERESHWMILYLSRKYLRLQ